MREWLLLEVKMEERGPILGVTQTKTQLSGCSSICLSHLKVQTVCIGGPCSAWGAPRKSKTLNHELLSAVSRHQCVNVTVSGRMRDNIVKHLSAMMEGALCKCSPLTTSNNPGEVRHCTAEMNTWGKLRFSDWPKGKLWRDNISPHSCFSFIATVSPICSLWWIKHQRRKARSWEKKKKECINPMVNSQGGITVLGWSYGALGLWLCIGWTEHLACVTPFCCEIIENPYL